MDHKNLFCTPNFSKLHPSYHLNYTQPDHAMWESSPSKYLQPYDDMCHGPPLTKLTNHTLPHHHLPKWNPNPNFPPLLPSPWQPPATIHGHSRTSLADIAHHLPSSAVNVEPTTP